MQGDEAEASAGLQVIMDEWPTVAPETRPCPAQSGWTHWASWAMVSIS